MADLSITAASVLPSTATPPTVSVRGTAGVNCTAGQVLYGDSTNLQLADANVNAAASNCVGIAMHGALAGQPLSYCTSGLIAIGATVVTGMPYFVSTTAGGIRPASDVANTDYICIVGYGYNTTHLLVDITATGLQIGADIT